jgi:small subunit ribosomal protein S3Ae
MVSQQSKRGSKVRDKWRDKQWIIINSPPAFGGAPLNYLPVTDPQQAIGRVVENTLFDLLKHDMTQHQIKIYVQIEKIIDGIASTTFKGHEYAKEFLRSLIRRGSSMITFIHDYTTLDGYTFRVELLALSHRRINSSKKHNIRLIAHETLQSKIAKLTLDQFVQEVVLGKAASDVLTEAKKIAVIRHLGIKKTKLISTPKSRAIHEAKTVPAQSDTSIQ